jgi:hypothetical protein
MSSSQYSGPAQVEQHIGTLPLPYRATQVRRMYICCTFMLFDQKPSPLVSFNLFSP